MGSIGTGLTQTSGENMKLSVESTLIQSKPEILSQEDFDTQAKNKQLIYRGVTPNEQENMSSKEVINDILSDSAIYEGKHAHGYGLYLTTSKASALSKYSENEDAIITAFLNPKAKIITERDLHKLYKDKIGTPKNNTEINTFALSQGYNVIQVEGGPSSIRNSVANRGKDGEDYYVVLDKKVLTVRKL